jgi:hypothetical protein
MMAMFAGSDAPAAQPDRSAPAAPEAPTATATSADDAAAAPAGSLEGPSVRPSAEIDADDELLDDLASSAEEESQRRWFNR